MRSEGAGEGDSEWRGKKNEHIKGEKFGNVGRWPVVFRDGVFKISCGELF